MRSFLRNHFYSLSRLQPLHFNFFLSAGWVPFLCQCVSMATERQVGGEAAGTRLSVFQYRPQESPQESRVGRRPTDATRYEEVTCWRPTFWTCCLSHGFSDSKQTSWPEEKTVAALMNQVLKNGHFREHQVPLQSFILLRLRCQKFHPDSLGCKCSCWPSAKEKKPGSGAITTAFQNASLLLSEHITLLWATGPLSKCVYLPCTSRKTSPLSHFEPPPPPLSLQSVMNREFPESAPAPLLAVCRDTLTSPAKGIPQITNQR